MKILKRQPHKLINKDLGIKDRYKSKHGNYDYKHSKDNHNNEGETDIEIKYNMSTNTNSSISGAQRRNINATNRIGNLCIGESVTESVTPSWHYSSYPEPSDAVNSCCVTFLLWIVIVIHCYVLYDTKN